MRISHPEGFHVPEMLLQIDDVDNVGDADADKRTNLSAPQVIQRLFGKILDRKGRIGSETVIMAPGSPDDLLPEFSFDFQTDFFLILIFLRMFLIKFRQK